ncbi:MAG: hypothetical protein ACLFP0_08805, partial [Rhodosalinus sp.]
LRRFKKNVIAWISRKILRKVGNMIAISNQITTRPTEQSPRSGRIWHNPASPDENKFREKPP